MLDLSATRVTDAGLANLERLTNLQSLNMGFTKVTDVGLAHLKGLTQLQWLWLGDTQAADAGLAYVRGLTKLQLLDLVKTQVTNAGLANLKELSQLRWLYLGGTQVTDAGLIHLEGLTKLRCLDLINTKVTDPGLEHLKGLTQLRSLYLGGTQVTDAGVKKLQQDLPNCKIDRTILDENTPPSTTPSQGKTANSAPVSPVAPKANDQSGKTSATNPADEVSPASDQPATKEGAKTESKPVAAQGLTAGLNTDEAKAIAEIEKLGSVAVDEKSPGKPVIRVILSGNRVTDAALEHIKDLSHLVLLELGETRITDAGLKHVMRLNRLGGLRLYDTQITDAGLEYLKGLKQLEWLDLNSTKITDAGLEHLRGLTKLRELDLYATHVTDAGVKMLQQVLPNCKINRVADSAVATPNANDQPPGGGKQSAVTERNTAQAKAIAQPRVRGEDAPKSSPVPDRVCAKLQALFHKYYPKTTITNRDVNGIHFEYEVMTFEFPYTGPPGGKHEATTQRGPKKGGVLCSVYLEKGEYHGQLELGPSVNRQYEPYVIDRKVYKQLLMAPYSAKRDAHLWVSLSYPSDASDDFLKDFRALMNDYENDVD